ncbi:MAG: hypothetical protein WC184_11880 [Acidimicrobiia bacterium]
MDALGRPELVMGDMFLDGVHPTVTQRTYIWQYFEGRGWPLTANEETIFVRQLRKIAENTTQEPSRSEITAVLNGMRCGLSTTNLLEQVPGLCPSKLYGAYRFLAQQLRTSLKAWDSIVAESSLSSLEVWGDNAAKVLPSVINQIQAYSEFASTKQLSKRITHLNNNIVTHGVHALQVEHWMATSKNTITKAELGRFLYDPYQVGVWSQAYFLPTRVGVLTPTIVNNLLENTASAI